MTKIGQDYFDQEATEIRVIQEAAKSAIETHDKRTQTRTTGGVMGGAVAGSARQDFTDYLFNVDDDDEKPKKKGYMMAKELSQYTKSDAEGLKSPERTKLHHLFRKNEHHSRAKADALIDSAIQKKKSDRPMGSVLSTKELTNLLRSKDQNASMPNMQFDYTETDTNVNASIDIPTLPTP